MSFFGVDACREVVDAELCFSGDNAEETEFVDCKVMHMKCGKSQGSRDPLSKPREWPCWKWNLAEEKMWK